MPKPLEPYRCPFSISYEIAAKLSDVTYRLGKLSMIVKTKPGEEEAALAVTPLLEMMEVNLRNAQIRRLKEGDILPSVPLANELMKLVKKYRRLEPYNLEFLTTLENIIFPDGVPVRLSRRAEDFPYPVPMRAKVEDLLNGIFNFVNNANGKIHPIILASVMYFELVAIARYRKFNSIFATIVFKAALVKYDPIFAFTPIERYLKNRKEELDASFAACVEKSDMAPFLSFILTLIGKAIDSSLTKVDKIPPVKKPLVNKLLAVMQEGEYYSTLQLCELLGLKSRLGVQLNYIRPALEAKVIAMSNPGSPNDRMQRYYKL